MDNKLKFAVITLTTLLITDMHAADFRGGTISWRPLGGRKVAFEFKMGWAYGKGPGCDETKIGQLVKSTLNTFKAYQWECSSGCPATTHLADLNYYCADANAKEQWEQGQNSFTYTFPNDGPFVVSFTGSPWPALNTPGKGGGNWYVATTVNLGKRSDTGDVNSSPISVSKPMYYVQYECDVELHIPVIDPDGDTVRCRWSVGNECNKVCKDLPGAVLDATKCILKFKTGQREGYIGNGLYAVALTIEDFPRTPITIGTVKKTPTDPLSSVPIQFLVKTRVSPTTCDVKPGFMSSSRPENYVFTIEEGRKFRARLDAEDKSTGIKDITSVGVVGLIVSKPALRGLNRFSSAVTWQTALKDVGYHVFCYSVFNNNGISGNTLCYGISVVHKGCRRHPCQHGGKCVSGKTGFICKCRPGFTGAKCETDIDDCQPNPCQNGGTCVDGINSFTCNCVTGLTGHNCNINIDDCKPHPCQNGGTCVDGINSFTCNCATGFTGHNCNINIDDCQPNPCQNGGTCVDGINSFTCNCVTGLTGHNCNINIDDCKPHPCQNGGTCVDGINSFTCNCATGFTGHNCNINIDDCQPNPCQNGGTCIDGINSFTCNCVTGFTGHNCNISGVMTTKPTVTSRSSGGSKTAAKKISTTDATRNGTLTNEKSSSDSSDTVKYVLIGFFSAAAVIGLSFVTHRFSGRWKMKTRRNPRVGESNSNQPVPPSSTTQGL